MEHSPSPSRPPPSDNPRPTTVFDLDADALVHCARNLSLQDLSNMAMTCKFFRQSAYSDSIWYRLFREHWPQQCTSSSFLPISGVREAYLARHTALRQFKFHDPRTYEIFRIPTLCSQILLDRNHAYVAQGSVILSMKDVFEEFSLGVLRDHNARITCMRLFSNMSTWFRSEAQNNTYVLVTSSCDWTIRLWWKDHSQRCFRGHNGPVTTLSDKLLGGSGGEVLASGGEDGTIRLWSLSSSGKRGQKALKATLHGHEKPLTLLSVSGHNPSLLVSVSKDAKVRVWDTNASLGARSLGCVGMASVHGTPVGIRCHEALCYIAAGSSVTAIDLRTMRKVSTAAIHQPKIYSFQSLPSKSLICTGGDGKATLWDTRKNQDKPQPIANMDGHSGHIAHLHMDPCKIVTGGPKDSYVKIWETDTGIPTNSFTCCTLDEAESVVGLSAMAVNGCRIVASCCGEEAGRICIRDFTNASCPILPCESGPTSKFWEPQVYSHSGILLSLHNQT